jgi:hypothetical protein
MFLYYEDELITRVCREITTGFIPSEFPTSVYFPSPRLDHFRDV